MNLSNSQLRSIADEYDRIRRANNLKSMERREAIHEEIPEIAGIDREIIRFSIQEAKHRLYQSGGASSADIHARIQALTAKKRPLLKAHGYPEDYLDPLFSCPYCQDTGTIDGQECICYKEKVRDILFDRSNLSELFGEANFSRFRLSYYSDDPERAGDYGLEEGVTPRENMRQILAVCREFIARFHSDPGQNLLIHGSAGVGKTFLSSCIGGELLCQNKSVLYLTAYRFFKELENNTFHKEEDLSYTIEDLISCDLLIIDDLGTELTNSFINSQLFLCLNERIMRRKSTIINTNLSLQRIQAVYSERVFSRLIESYTMLHIVGEDIRLLKALSGN